MTIRLLVVSTAKNNDRMLARLVASSNGGIEVALHVGDADCDIKGSSLMRLGMRTGGRGHPFAAQRWTGAARALIASPDFADRMELVIDQQHRRSDMNDHKAHPLRATQDYVDYYHILADVMGERIVASGATHALFFNVPHLGYDTIAYQIAVSLGLPVTIVTQSQFPGRYFSMRAPEEMGRLAPDAAGPPHPIEKGATLDLFYMKGIKQEREEGGTPTAKGMLNIALFLALKRPWQALNPVYLWRLARDVRRVYGAFPKWRDPFARYFHTDALEYFDHLATFEDGRVDLEGDFVYFPLQMQPEMTTSSLGGRYRDQALAIETLADMLPEGVRILVKENPKQGRYMRGPMFFHRLARIPAVTLLPSWADTHALTARARFVATITGTVGWEAIRQGKPALVFGAAWYRDLPGVHHIEDAPGWDAIIGTEIDHAELERRTGALLAATHPGVVDRFYERLVPDFDDARNVDRVVATLRGLLDGTEPTTFRSR